MELCQSKHESNIFIDVRTRQFLSHLINIYLSTIGVETDSMSLTKQFINWTKNKKLQFASYYISVANPWTEKFGKCMYSGFCELTSIYRKFRTPLSEFISILCTFNRHRSILNKLNNSTRNKKSQRTSITTIDERKARFVTLSMLWRSEKFGVWPVMDRITSCAWVVNYLDEKHARTIDNCSLRLP